MIPLPSRETCISSGFRRDELAQSVKESLERAIRGNIVRKEYGEGGGYRAAPVEYGAGADEDDSSGASAATPKVRPRPTPRPRPGASSGKTSTVQKSATCAVM